MATINVKCKIPRRHATSKKSNGRWLLTPGEIRIVLTRLEQLHLMPEQPAMIRYGKDKDKTIMTLSNKSNRLKFSQLVFNQLLFEPRFLIRQAISRP